MDGQIDGWLAGWMDGWLNGQMVGWTKKCVCSGKFGELTLRLFQGENDVLNQDLLYI